jgi:hypothetical protein
MEPVTSIDDLVIRFAQRRPFAASSTSLIQRFNPDTFTRLAKEHADRHDFSEIQVAVGHRPSAAYQQPAPIINNVATFDKNIFFQDPNDLTRVFSCCDDAMKNYFTNRGFVQLPVQHFTGTPAEQVNLPTLKVSEPQPVSQHDLERAPGPSALSLPHEFPNLWIPRNKTYAWSILHAFEVKVYDPKSGKVYSPYRFWTKEVRSQFGTKPNSKFTKYCQAYFIIRRFHSDTLALCELNMTQLAKAGAEYNSAHPLQKGKDEWLHRVHSILPRHLAPR